MMKKIFLFIDYREQFYFSTKYRGASVDTDKLKQYLGTLDYELIVKGFSEINFRKENYKGQWILYQSSEDPSLYYKDYVEDIVLTLKMQGARLIPNFKYFRAHHNKVFMELLRDILPISEIKNIHSHSFGTFEEYQNSSYSKSLKQLVLKPSSGTRSRGVSLLSTKVDKKKLPFRISRTFTFDNLKLWISKIKTSRSFVPMSNNRHKFLVQNAILGLKGDYRILVYGNKYYSVFRKNRKGGFTASGSGNLDFNHVLPNGLLDYTKEVYTKLDTPFVSLDIGHKEGKFYLFEFQCISLGQYTLEKSKFFYKQSGGGNWERINETPDLEREISTTVVNFIKKHK